MQKKEKMAPTRVILLSCGSFDPPTKMHLRMFEMARDHLHRIGTHIVVGGVISPVHDSYSRRKLESSKHRLAMLRLSLKEIDWVPLSTWECRQNGWTNTLKCLQYHQNLLNSFLCKTNDVKNQIKEEDLDWIPEDIRNNSYSGPITIKLLCGVDLLESFANPDIWTEEEVEAIVGQYGLVVINREGSTPNKFIQDSDRLSRHQENIITVTNWFPNESNYTNIRRALKWNESMKPFLQDSVIHYIYQNEIYGVKRMSTKEKSTVDQTVLGKLEAGFAKLAASDSKSLLKKHLTLDVFNRLKTQTTSFGCTLLDVIQSGVEHLDSEVGVYAPDAESYTVFADLFDPIIEDYHGGFKKTDKHPPMDFGDFYTLRDLDPEQEYIEFMSMRCRRSLKRYPFSPCMTEIQYKDIEDIVSSNVTRLGNEFVGTFYSYAGMNRECYHIPADTTLNHDPHLLSANVYRFWPTGRGVFRNYAKNLFVNCNQDDHLVIAAMMGGGNMGEVYRILETAVNRLGKRLPYSHSDRLGFLTLCPTNLGTTFDASVSIILPKFTAYEAHREILEEVVSKFNLYIEVSSDSEITLYDIHNSQTLGITEYETVKDLHDGVAELIKIEKEL